MSSTTRITDPRGRRRAVHTVAATAAAAVSLGLPRWARSAPSTVRVGYAISRTGPWAPGAQTSQEPNYILWAETQNAAGGLNVEGKRRRIELVGVDDRSNLEACVRAYNQLMNVEQVDLLLPPWGSNACFAVAPLANRMGHVFLAPTASSRRLVDSKLPCLFLMLQPPSAMAAALVGLLKSKGVATLATIHVDDLFGLENQAALKLALRDSGITVVDEHRVSEGSPDLAPLLRDLKAKDPDAFVSYTYGSDTLQVTRQARGVGFNPRCFYAAVGTAYPGFRQQLGAATVEGVLGMGSWNARTSPAAQAYFKAHTRRFAGKEPDRWASGHGWAALEILTQAVAKVGLDRKALREHVATHEHPTLIGPVRFADGTNVSTPGSVGQWQQGEFEVVWPPKLATSPVVADKPVWR